MSGTYEKGESSSSSREGESEEESKFSPTPTYEVNSSIMNESHDAIQKPKGGKKAKFKKGMTEGTAVNARNKIKTQKDVEDMIDEEQDSDNESVRKKRENEKSKMKKISNKVKNKDGKDADQKANKKNVKDKLARAQDKIKKMMANKNEGNKGGNDGGSMDPVATANQRKEFDKNSNAQIMNKIAESEQNHGDLTFGSYIILNLNGENDDSRKFSTQFRISDKVQAHKMDKEDYNEN